MSRTPHDLVYLDNAASTPVDPRVLAAMAPYWSERYGNAGALHSEGTYAKEAIRTAREQVAAVLGVASDEVIFTSGGTEANNLAVVGLFRSLVHEGRAPERIHMITSTIEHSSVLDCFRALEREGMRVSYVPVDSNGRISADEIVRATTEDTVLISCMYTSNEIGVVEPLGEIKRALGTSHTTGKRPLVHTDASQAPAWLACKAHSLGVDMLTLDAQKVYGPKGIGCLYRARPVVLEPVLYGGDQEFGLRPGTPPTPLIVGFSEALRLVEEERAQYVDVVRNLRDRLIALIRERVPGVVLNGPSGRDRLANNCNFSFPGLDGERIVVELDVEGIAASTRSACLFAQAPGSYVVRALGKGDDVAKGAVRFTLSRHTTQAEIDRTALVLGDVVHRLYNEVNGGRRAGY